MQHYSYLGCPLCDFYFYIFKMKKVTLAVWTDLSAQGDEQGAKDADTFLTMYERNFHRQIGSQTLKGQNEKKAQKPPKVVKHEDIRKLNFGLLRLIQEALDAFRENPTEANYFKLSKLILVFLLIYNRKRAGVS